MLRWSDVAEWIAHGHVCGLEGDDLEQHAGNRGYQFVIHLFSLEFDQGLTLSEGVPFPLEPADNVDPGGIHATRLGHSENCDGVALHCHSLITVILERCQITPDEVGVNDIYVSATLKSN